MSQKSLLSFFGTKPNSKEDSPPGRSSLSKSLKRVVCESDDSSCDTLQVKCESEKCLDASPKEEAPKAVSISYSGSPPKKKAKGNAVTNTRPAKGGKQSSLELPKTVESLSSVSSKEEISTDVNVSVPSKPEIYNPSAPNYNPISDATWNKGENVPYLSLAKTFVAIESTSGRLKTIEILSNFFRSVGLLSPNDLSTCVQLCLNQIGPAYMGIELGVGETILLKAIGMTTGVALEHLKPALKRQGDVGTLAGTIRSRQKTMFIPKPLTVSVVFQKLKEIASMSGNASQTKKVERICSLLIACRECEAKYLIRSLSGKLRIGLAEQSVLTALGQACALTPFHSAAAIQEGSASGLLNANHGLSSDQWKSRLDECVANVKKAYCVCPDYKKLVVGLLADGPDGLRHHCFITPGIPVKPMLAHPTRGVTEVLKRFDEADFTCEYKYDGERAQIHVINPSTCQVFSRNQENNTAKYPDIVNTLMPRVVEQAILTDFAREQLTSEGTSSQDSVSVVESCILDSEVVAWDRNAGHILPFQVLSTRKRKDVDEASVKVQVCVYAFDLLYLNNVSFIEKPLRVRREVLRQIFSQIEGEFMLATSLDSSDTEEIAGFLDESIKGNCEGLMVKTLDHNATYEIAKRSHNWLKLKKDYLDSVGDTLDLVVIGGFHGSGKRTGRYGGFLLACYDADGEEYQTICKIGTGMKDEDLANFSNFFKDHVIPEAKPYYQYASELIPDHWFEPVQVWEVKAADLSISPAHKAAAGLADPEKGISLRFPRFLRVRDDKKPEEATAAQQVFEMYKSQEQIKNQDQKEPAENEDDLY